MTGLGPDRALPPAQPPLDGHLQDNPIWQQDNVVLRSVGIDVGSSSTQVVFSRLHLRRIGEDLTSRYVVIDRQTTYASPVALTPYVKGETIDAEELGRMVDHAYAAAQLKPGDVDTGVVILTGEALRRRNARRIADVLATLGGEFVTAAAGHNMEAMLAAYGSGAAKASYDRGQRILNIDLGGGTTKLAICAHGRVVATTAIHVGGRLVVVDKTGRITRLEPAGALHAQRAGLDWHVGAAVDSVQMNKVAEHMADAILAAVIHRPLPDDIAALHLAPPLERPADVDAIMFSGGVAEHVTGHERGDFGDLGLRLGLSLRLRIDAGELPAPVVPAAQRIRATVLGASQYSVQLSGSTCTLDDAEDLLPRRDVPVVSPLLDLGVEVDPTTVAGSIRDRVHMFNSETVGEDIVLALSWSGPPVYARIRALAEGIVIATAERLRRGLPLFIVLDGDVAKTLGTIIRNELGVEVPLIVLDGIALRELDYVDIGKRRWPSGTVPVTVKSLVFENQAVGDST